MTAYYTKIPHFRRGNQRMDAYRRHQLAWSLLHTAEKKERDFVFYMNDSNTPLLFHFVSPNPLIPGLSKQIENVTEGDTIRWRLLCNPVNKMGNKKIPIRDLNQAKTWLTKKLGTCLELETFQAQFLPLDSARKPGGNTIFIQQMLAEGKGKVTNPQALLRITTQGIGPSKAFGYGCFLWNKIQPKKQKP
jgi:CRISPR-associated protein Cas6/Cse3/CasE subtype I-E